jgi:hypothetical protein
LLCSKRSSKRVTLCRTVLIRRLDGCRTEARSKVRCGQISSSRIQFTIESRKQHTDTLYRARSDRVALKLIERVTPDREQIVADLRCEREPCFHQALLQSSVFMFSRERSPLFLIAVLPTTILPSFVFALGELTGPGITPYPIRMYP